VVPLRGVEWSLGAIAAEADDPSELTAVEASLLQLLASVSAVALERVRQLEQATQASRTDPLTQLANRRVFDESLAQHLAECDRYGHTLSLVLADVDQFKVINDTHGHAAGDTVLVALARAFASSVRDVDLCARYGGEELAFLLPHTSLDRARDVAERLRCTAEELAGSWKGQQIPVTVSFGVACYPVSAGRGDALFASADRALYAAKSGGRNCVKCAMPSTYVKTA
jgi:diguanylate cyclase (GGDEF)-like protein